MAPEAKPREKEGKDLLKLESEIDPRTAPLATTDTERTKSPKEGECTPIPPDAEVVPPHGHSLPAERRELDNPVAAMLKEACQASLREAEAHVDGLISKIQPNRHSIERRHAVFHYVQRLFNRCHGSRECTLSMFGSVPLRTYLPDGDIDLTALYSGPPMNSWTDKLRDILHAEEKNPLAEFSVRDVQTIHAEVKLMKCLVGDIVVDISTNQLGGLSTLCFLEEVDRYIGQENLFKRSIILVKAWCYYESRVLGAHHGLISTYALETLVLYIFNLFHKCLKTPLQVAERSCGTKMLLSSAPLCIITVKCFNVYRRDLPEEVPLVDGGLLLSDQFLADMVQQYQPTLNTHAEQRRTFVTKHFNVVDPLLPHNNLGRSVSQSNLIRIRRAFAHGATKLGKALRQEEPSNAVAEVDRFFGHTQRSCRDKMDITPDTTGSLNSGAGGLGFGPTLPPFPMHPPLPSMPPPPQLCNFGPPPLLTQPPLPPDPYPSTLQIGNAATTVPAPQAAYGADEQSIPASNSSVPAPPPIPRNPRPMQVPVQPPLPSCPHPSYLQNAGNSSASGAPGVSGTQMHLSSMQRTPQASNLHLQIKANQYAESPHVEDQTQIMQQSQVSDYSGDIQWDEFPSLPSTITKSSNRLREVDGPAVGDATEKLKEVTSAVKVTAWQQRPPLSLQNLGSIAPLKTSTPKGLSNTTKSTPLPSTEGSSQKIDPFPALPSATISDGPSKVQEGNPGHRVMPKGSYSERAATPPAGSLDTAGSDSSRGQEGGAGTPNTISAECAPSQKKPTAGIARSQPSSSKADHEPMSDKTKNSSPRVTPNQGLNLGAQACPTSKPGHQSHSTVLSPRAASHHVNTVVSCGKESDPAATLSLKEGTNERPSAAGSASLPAASHVPTLPAGVHQLVPPLELAGNGDLTSMLWLLASHQTPLPPPLPPGAKDLSHLPPPNLAFSTSGSQLGKTNPLNRPGGYTSHHGDHFDSSKAPLLPFSAGVSPVIFPGLGIDVTLTPAAAAAAMFGSLNEFGSHRGTSWPGEVTAGYDRYSRSSAGFGGGSILTGELEHHRQNLAIGRHRRQQHHSNFRAPRFNQAGVGGHGHGGGGNRQHPQHRGNNTGRQARSIPQYPQMFTDLPSGGVEPPSAAIKKLDDISRVGGGAPPNNASGTRAKGSKPSLPISESEQRQSSSSSDNQGRPATVQSRGEKSSASEGQYKKLHLGKETETSTKIELSQLQEGTLLPQASFSDPNEERFKEDTVGSRGKGDLTHARNAPRSKDGPTTNGEAEDTPGNPPKMTDKEIGITPSRPPWNKTLGMNPTKEQADGSADGKGSQSQPPHVLPELPPASDDDIHLARTSPSRPGNKGQPKELTSSTAASGVAKETDRKCLSSQQGTTVNQQQNGNASQQTGMLDAKGGDEGVTSDVVMEGGQLFKHNENDFPALGRRASKRVPAAVPTPEPGISASATVTRIPSTNAWGKR